ncbi:MAG: hypothetical protein QGH49_13285 [SAR324 cluster bacterium]|nr:hypothetical protein [SAR324 cluster bacterium]
MLSFCSELQGGVTESIAGGLLSIGFCNFGHQCPSCRMTRSKHLSVDSQTSETGFMTPPMRTQPRRKRSHPYTVQVEGNLFSVSQPPPRTRAIPPNSLNNWEQTQISVLNLL